MEENLRSSYDQIFSAHNNFVKPNIVRGDLDKNLDQYDLPNKIFFQRRSRLHGNVMHISY